MNKSTGIGTPKTLPITQLSTFHDNPRRGDIHAIADSLEANGQFRPIVVNKGTHTGRPYEILAGNHTYLAYQHLAETHPDNPQWQHMDTYLVDVDDNRATKIVLADNRTSDLGTYDEGELLSLLESVDDDLDGTGYDYDDLNDLLSASSTAVDDFTAYFEAQTGEEGPQQGEDIPLTPSGALDVTSPHEDGSDAVQSTQDDSGEPEEIWLALTFSVTVEQRRRIRAVLTEIKNREDLPTQAEALVHAIDSYPGLDVDEVVADTKAELTKEVSGDGNTINEEITK